MPELFPINIFDKIPTHPVRLVNKVVDELDIADIIHQYKGGGCSAYHPRMMIKVLFYGYLSNIYSCRKIAKALEEHIHFMFMSGNATPDFLTINDFRGKILKDKIKAIFAQVVKMLVELGYVSLEVQYIDSTKIESQSNRYTFVWRASVEKNKAKLEGKIHAILSAIDVPIQSDGQSMEKAGTSRRVSSNGFVSEVRYYQEKRWEACPLRGLCHQGKGERKIEVNHRLNDFKEKARGLLMSEKGLIYRSKRPMEVEAVFGQMKSNNQFNRFTFKGLEKVALEFLLMAIGHNLRKMTAKAKRGLCFYFYYLKMIFDALQNLPKRLFLNQKYIFQKTRLQYLS